MAASSIIGSLVYSLIYTRTCVSFCNTLIHTERLYTFTAGSQLPTHVRHQVLYFYSYFLVVLTSTSMVDPCFLLHHSLIFAMFSSRVCTAGFKLLALVSHEAFLWLIHVRCWHYSSLCLQQRQFCFCRSSCSFKARGGKREAACLNLGVGVVTSLTAALNLSKEV